MQHGGARFTQRSGFLIRISSHWGSLCLLPIRRSCSHTTLQILGHMGQGDDAVFPISSIHSSHWTIPHNLSVHDFFSNPLYPCTTTWDSAYASASPLQCELPTEQRAKRMINLKKIYLSLLTASISLKFWLWAYDVLICTRNLSWAEY